MKTAKNPFPAERTKEKTPTTFVEGVYLLIAIAEIVALPD
jgi:hypothetical protein